MKTVIISLNKPKHVDEHCVWSVFSYTDIPWLLSPAKTFLLVLVTLVVKCRQDRPDACIVPQTPTSGEWKRATVLINGSSQGTAKTTSIQLDGELCYHLDSRSVPCRLKQPSAFFSSAVFVQLRVESKLLSLHSRLVYNSVLYIAFDAIPTALPSAIVNGSARVDVAERRGRGHQRHGQ